MKDFTYCRPSTVSEAVALLATGDESRPMSGGMTLLPTMKQRLASPKTIVDLAALPGLTGITIAGGTISIGAMTTHAEVASSAAVKAALPALAALAGGIGDPAVRHRGTIGGSVANADPAADYPAGVLGLNAVVVTHERHIKADDFFLGLFETALLPGEIITSVRSQKPARVLYLKFRHPASGYA